MIHEAYNTAYIAERYYKEVGKPKPTRTHAKKAFWALKHPNKEVLQKIFSDIFEESKLK